MGAYVSPTDRRWFDFLASRGALDEVNFWLPNPWGGRFGVLRRGEPLLFKLKAPTNAIAGGGFFEHYTELPVSEAWATFGEKNGAPSPDQVRNSILSLRRESAAGADPVIGCILLVEPFFWPRELWIPQPDDWRPSIVRGKRYEFSTPIGMRLWEQVIERLGTRRSGRSVAEVPRVTIPGGYGDPLLRPRRIGQGTLRALVLDAYSRQCAITRERALPALETAHILPFSETQTHNLRHALLLRADVHRLFDAGYITVTPGYHVLASSRMKDDFNGGESYLQLHGTTIHLPASRDLHPDPTALSWHNENRFRG